MTYERQYLLSDQEREERLRERVRELEAALRAIACGGSRDRMVRIAEEQLGLAPTASASAEPFGDCPRCFREDREPGFSHCRSCAEVEVQQTREKHAQLVAKAVARPSEEVWTEKEIVKVKADAKELEAVLGPDPTKVGCPSEALPGFRQTEPDPDHSTVHCPCGSSFTWSGYNAGLAVWEREHRAHLGETVQITEVYRIPAHCPADASEVAQARVGEILAAHTPEPTGKRRLGPRSNEAPTVDPDALRSAATGVLDCMTVLGDDEYAVPEISIKRLRSALQGTCSDKALTPALCDACGHELDRETQAATENARAHAAIGAGGGDEEGYVHPDVLASQSSEFQAEYAARESIKHVPKGGLRSMLEFAYTPDEEKSGPPHRRDVRAALRKRALVFLNSEDRENEVGHDHVAALTRLLEDVRDKALRSETARSHDFEDMLAWISDYAGSSPPDNHHPLWTDARVTENEASSLYDLLLSRPWATQTGSGGVP